MSQYAEAPAERLATRNAAGCHSCQYWQPYGGARDAATIGVCLMAKYRRKMRYAKKRNGAAMVKRAVHMDVRQEHMICSDYQAGVKSG